MEVQIEIFLKIILMEKYFVSQKKSLEKTYLMQLDSTTQWSQGLRLK